MVLIMIHKFISLMSKELFKFHIGVTLVLLNSINWKMSVQLLKDSSAELHLDHNNILMLKMLLKELKLIYLTKLGDFITEIKLEISPHQEPLETNTKIKLELFSHQDMLY